MSGTLESNPRMTGREQIIRDIRLRLGGGMVDVELDPEHYDFAVNSALQRYRARSGNAMEESFVFMDIQPEAQSYILPAEVQEVRAIYRRSQGGTAGGANIDPFSLSWTNSIYMMQNPGGLGTQGSGSLALYDFAMQYQELVGRMFGRDVLYTFDVATKRLTLHRRFTHVEQIIVHVYNARPEEALFADPYAMNWLKDWAYATAMIVLGEARSKFPSVGGPQGGVSMNGERLISDGKEKHEKLEEDLKMLVDQHDGMPFIIG